MRTVVFPANELFIAEVAWEQNDCSRNSPCGEQRRLGSGPTCADGCAATIDRQAAAACRLQSGAGANDAGERECSRFIIEATSLLVRWEPGRPRHAYFLGKEGRFHADGRFYNS